MVTTQTIIPTGLQKDLDQRIAAAGGSIATVRQELQKELHGVETQQNVSSQPQDTQVQVALLLAQIRYLDSLTTAAHEHAPKQGLWQRIGSIFAHKDA